MIMSCTSTSAKAMSRPAKSKRAKAKPASVQRTSGVQEVPREGRVAPGLLEVRQRERRGQLEVRGVGGGMERRPARVEERRDPEDGEEPGADFLDVSHR
jgi:hypothetical protein